MVWGGFVSFRFAWTLDEAQINDGEIANALLG